MEMKTINTGTLNSLWLAIVELNEKVDALTSELEKSKKVIVTKVTPSLHQDCDGSYRVF